MSKPNALYVMSGGGTAVISASAHGIAKQMYEHFPDKVGTLYAAVSGMRGALNEDLTDVFAYINAGSTEDDKRFRLNQLKFPATPVFGTSRHNPDQPDSMRFLDVCKVHDIHYAFFNGGNDTAEKAIRIQQYAKEQGFELYVICIPKTVDNDLLITHRCPGYPSFAKQVAIDTMSVWGDIDAFGIQPGAYKGGPIREGAVAQVMVFMGRDEGWGAAASVLGKYDESVGPHVILTKEGGFDKRKFLDRCQNAYDRFGRLLVVASEGAFDDKKMEYIGNKLEVMAYREGLFFKVHEDAHKNTSVTDSRVALYLKLLLEQTLKIPADIYKDFKVREEGPAYLNRNNLEIVSAVDFNDAINVGTVAANIAFGKQISGVMVTLTHTPGQTSYVELCNVADAEKGSKAMTKSIKTLDTAERPVFSPDGMMIDRELFEEYIGQFVDINGPNRRELLHKEGFQLPLRKIEWPLEARLLPPYEKAKK